MITLDNISKKIGSRVLFEDVSITFNTNARYGLAGPNGCGKSTLLKIMMDIIPATSGFVSMPKKVGFLKQNIEEFKDLTVIDTVIMGNEKLSKALTERDELYELEMSDEIGMRLAEIEEIIAEEDGYCAESEAEELLIGMGIEQDLLSQKMQSIPADRQFRVLLCQALFGHPQALLLDEPTNHLDLESIGWLEDFLHNYNGTLIVVSHDRHFLNAVTTHIADIDFETVIIYPGNYDEMVIAKTQVRERAEHETKSREKKISQLQDFISKFRAGTRASQVKSRMKEIEKLQPHELRKSNIQKPYIRFTPPDIPSGKLVFKIETISKAYNLPVINDFSLDIMKNEKIAVIGNNGLGKSTFLKMLAQKLAPDSGNVQVGHNVSIGYFPQNHLDTLGNSLDCNLFDYLKAVRENVYDQEIRSVLGKMLFAGDDAFKKISALSGGERARLIIASLMLTNPNTLILDEPNNHLDLEAVSALTWGLEEFQGTTIFASHDRDLISKAATKLIVFEKDSINIFYGTFSEYFDKKKV